MIFFVTVGEATMSYYVPVVMDKVLGGAALMGVIYATGSLFNVLFDFVFAKTLGGKKSRFFNKIAFPFMILFPISMLLFQSLASFLVTMLIWSIYFEAILFSEFHAIHESVEAKDHLWAWSTMSFVKNIAFIIGPIVASLSAGYALSHPLFLALGFYILAFAVMVVRVRFDGHKAREGQQEKKLEPHSTREELSIWRGYAKVIWPLLFLTFLFFLVDSTFFSIGPLFSEKLKLIHPFGGFFVSMYTIPFAIFIFFTKGISARIGKKRTAFVAGILAGVGLFIMSQSTNLFSILALI